MNDLDTVLDRVQSILNQLGDIVEGVRAENLEPTEPLATVDVMTVGGWTKMPGRQRWRKIVAITECVMGPNGNACYRIDFADGGPDGSYVHVTKWSPYPFLTAEQFDTACDRERDTQEDEADDRLHHAEWKAGR